MSIVVSCTRAKRSETETEAWVGQGVYINEDTHNIGDFDLAN